MIGLETVGELAIHVGLADIMPHKLHLNVAQTVLRECGNLVSFLVSNCTNPLSSQFYQHYIHPFDCLFK